MESVIFRDKSDRKNHCGEIWKGWRSPDAGRRSFESTDEDWDEIGKRIEAASRPRRVAGWKPKRSMCIKDIWYPTRILHEDIAKKEAMAAQGQPMASHRVAC